MSEPTKGAQLRQGAVIEGQSAEEPDPDNLDFEISQVAADGSPPSTPTPVVSQNAGEPIQALPLESEGLNFYRRVASEGEPRRTAAAVRYSRFVDTMKVALPILAAVALVAVIAMTIRFRNDPKIAIDIPSEPGLVQAQLMETLELSGFDDMGRPYKLTATTARRDKDHENLITLTELNGWMGEKKEIAAGDAVLGEDQAGTGTAETARANETTVVSDSGLWNTEARLLDLTGHVVMTDSAAYRIETETALVNMATREITGDSHVHVVMDWGMIDADGFDAFDQQEKVIFRGNVQTIAY